MNERKGIYMIQLLLSIHTVLVTRTRARASGTGWSRNELSLRGDAGQTTAEYALVLLGAAAIAALVVTWATKSGAISKLFETVLSHVIGAVT